jgi:ferredoxin-NADP reductase
VGGVGGRRPAPRGRPRRARPPARAPSFRLALGSPSRRLAGQAYVIRLTAPDGYRAQRTYSVANAPADAGHIELAVDRLPDGEVSAFLHDVVVPGDTFEVRGPVGGWFVWRPPTPALLVGGGSGLVPLVAMLRHARAAGCADRMRLVAAVRTPGDLPFAGELTGPEVTVTCSRGASRGGRPPGRLTGADVGTVEAGTLAYVCGSTGFCDHVTGLLLGAGVPAATIRIERFGPS